MKNHTKGYRLALKLVLASVAIELVMLSLLVMNSLRLLEDNLMQQAKLRLEEVTPLLNSALATPLAQRDYATVNEILRDSRRKNGMEYLVVADAAGKIVGVSGRDAAQVLPHFDQTLADAEDSDHVYDTMLPITIAGQNYGKVYYGVSVDFMTEAKQLLFRQSATIALAEVILSMLLLFGVGYWLTRHLKLLAEASTAVAGGDFNISVPVNGNDEVAVLSRAFNTMTAAVRQRIEDLSDSHVLQEQFLREAQQERARLASLLSVMNTGILFIGPDRNIVYVNPAFQQSWMMTDKASLLGKPATSIFRYADNALVEPEAFQETFNKIMSGHDASGGHQVNFADGRVLMQKSYPVRNERAEFIGRLWMYQDVTSERKTAEQLAYLADRDSLTGLYNRRRFQEELTRMATEIDRRGDQGALLCFDLDEFKYVNDTLGHRAGDALLNQVANAIDKLIRRNEFLFRLGGDEFAVLLPTGTERDAQGAAERIVRAVAQIPFQFEQHSLRLTASLGIAIYPTHATNAEELVAHADAAMYQAKSAGKNAWRLYRQDLDASREMVRRLSWNERIARAVDNDLLVLHFQGVYGTQTGALSHLEVLVRMIDEDNPSGRLLMPGQFIPFAEKSGKILDIDRWVIRKTIGLLAQHPEMPALAVNISGRSFDEPSLPEYIADLLTEHRVAPQRLHVELTETEAVSDLHDAQRFIDALHRTGCKVCLDDFGAGFSSFAYLKHLQVDVLKIDGQFIRDLPSDRNNYLFVRAMVEIARSMGKKTIAEFVETEEVLNLLKELGVDYVQGYFLNIPAAEHPAFITKAVTTAPTTSARQTQQ